MLEKAISYKSLFRIAGCCFVLYGLYLVMLALTAQTQVSGDVNYTGAMIFVYPEDVRNYLFCGGLFLGNPLLPVAPGGLNALGPLTPGPLL